MFILFFIIAALDIGICVIQQDYKLSKLPLQYYWNFLHFSLQFLQTLKGKFLHWGYDCWLCVVIYENGGQTKQEINII